MKNFIQHGKVLTYTNSGSDAIKSGDLVIVGTYAAVAITDIPVGETGSLKAEGVFEFPKATGAVTQGAKLYYVAADKNLSTTASGNTYVGLAFRAAASGDATVHLALANGI